MAHPKLNLLVLKTTQPTVVRDFYGLLGFQFQQEKHGSGPLHYSTPLGDGILEIYPLNQDNVIDCSTRLGFEIADMESVILAVSEQATVISEPRLTEWGLRAVVKDPDGRSIELYETQND